MKALILGLLALTISSHAQAESRIYKKISSSEAVVTIHTDEKDGTQALFYVDGSNNKKFLQDLLNDKSSEFYKAARAIVLENCVEDESDCGEVTLTDSVRTGFGRGGWMEAGSVYTAFLGFTHYGTGRFFSVDYQIEITEDAVAQVNSDYEYNGIVIKNLSATIKKIEK